MEWRWWWMVEATDGGCIYLVLWICECIHNTYTAVSEELQYLVDLINPHNCYNTAIHETRSLAVAERPRDAPCHLRIMLNQLFSVRRFITRSRIVTEALGGVGDGDREQLNGFQGWLISYIWHDLFLTGCYSTTALYHCSASDSFRSRLCLPVSCRQLEAYAGTVMALYKSIYLLSSTFGRRRHQFLIAYC